MIIIRTIDGVAVGIVAFILIPTAPCVAVGMFAVILMLTAPAAGMLPPDTCQSHQRLVCLLQIHASRTLKTFLNQLWYFRCKTTKTFRFG